jgi:hypothetical protein
MTEPAIDLMPVEAERLSASKFLKLVQENPGIIKSSRIVTPTPGAREFGSFDVVYTRPVYKSISRAALRTLK